MIGIWDLAIVLVLCGVLSVLSFRFRLLTMRGSLSAFVLGMFIGVLGSIGWLLILVIFTVFGFAVTRYRIRQKMSGGLQEGVKGERDHRNVLANGLVPAIIAIASFASGAQGEVISGAVYLSAISVAASDTVASEMGVLSDDVRLITTGEPVEPGTDGGVSAYGTAWAVLGALVASVVGWAILFPSNLLDARLLVPVAIGIIGCNIDSLIGATLERRGSVGKLGNNIASMAIGSLIALPLLLLM
ncbi:MAG: DUF92 domain-containing protein [Methanomassiliicoccales archaeon]